MEPFHSKAKQQRHADDLAARLNPTQGRTAAESMRILRKCRLFAANIEYLVNVVPDVRPLFEHRDIVTDTDDEAIVDWRAIAENVKGNGYDSDARGLLVNMQDKKVRASNRIEAVTTYTDFGPDAVLRHDYMLRKTLFSPFKCDTWGRLPLTLNQWAEFAFYYITAQARWQWQHAVTWYAEQRDLELYDRFLLNDVVGWNLVPAARLRVHPENQEQQEDGPEWTGPIFYTLAEAGPLEQTKPEDGNQK